MVDDVNEVAEVNNVDKVGKADEVNKVEIVCDVVEADKVVKLTRSRVCPGPRGVNVQKFIL